MNLFAFTLRIIDVEYVKYLQTIYSHYGLMVYNKLVSISENNVNYNISYFFYEYLQKS